MGNEIVTTLSTFAPILLPISVMLSGASASGTSFGSGRHVSEASSQPVYARSEKRIEALGTVATSWKISSGYSEHMSLPSWLSSTVDHIQSYVALEAGWKGPGSVAPSAAVIFDAVELVSQFATEMPTLVAPMVSADDDGTICLYWRDDPMMATIFVQGDGTFAFYAEGYDDPARSDDALVGLPLPSGLIAAMTGVVVSGFLAA